MGTNKDYQNRLPDHPEPLELGAHKEASALPPMQEAYHPHHVEHRHVTHKGSFLGWAWLTVLALGVLVGSIYWFSDRSKSNGDNMYASGVNQTNKTALASNTNAQPDAVITEVTLSEVEANAATKANAKTSNAAMAKAATAYATAKTATANANATAVPHDVVYLFPLDGSDIPDDATLNKLAKEVAATGAYVSVVAYTDESGNSAYNQRLSERRAKRVGDYLIAHGVPGDHVKTKGMGETNDYPTAAQDRRAEIHVTV